MRCRPLLTKERYYNNILTFYTQALHDGTHVPVLSKDMGADKQELIVSLADPNLFIMYHTYGLLALSLK